MYILSIDQGTTGTTTILFDKSGYVVDKAYEEIEQIYPHKGWVEHSPDGIWNSVVSTVSELLEKYPNQVNTIGITNQRETVVVWDKRTGKAVHNAIVWQCRRTVEMCQSLNDHTKMIKEKTGLPLDAYFSATKIAWILENVDEVKIEHLICGTVDSWLIYKLTGGKSFYTDYTNASRTMLFNIETKTWDDELLKLFNIPKQMLAVVKDSKNGFGVVNSLVGLNGVPIQAVAGDQQAALFGQGCFKQGTLKNTYGTGCFMLLQCEDKRVDSYGLITTLAINEDGKPSYALEGSVFSGGSTIQWLRDELGIISESKESEEFANRVDDNSGVYFVPAFTGLGSPYWDMNAKATISGLTRDSNKFHITRAALESIVFQSNDLLQAMKKRSGFEILGLKVDGGASANNFLMQFQADISNLPIYRAKNVETTALGVALLAGLQNGIWKNVNEIEVLNDGFDTFKPIIDNSKREVLLLGWIEAIRRTRSF